MESEYLSTVETLQRAARQLSSVCDGAASLDGHGFNGTDTQFGKSLAAQERWSPKQVTAAQKMLAKYAAQLKRYGIDITNLPKVEIQDLMTEHVKPQSIVSLSPDGIYIEWRFEYSFEEKEFIKHKFKAFYQPAPPPFWRRKVADVDEALLRTYCEKFDAAAGNEVWRAVRKIETAETKYIPPASIDDDIDDLHLEGFGIKPFPFQRIGIKYALRKTKAIIGDDMGLGKTFQALGVAWASGAWKQTIVVCPATVKINWQRATNQAIPAATTAVWGSKAGANANVVIINYDNLKKQLPTLLRLNPRMIVFDEFHYLKNIKSQRTTAALTLVKDVPYVLGLTGTPITNRPSELIAPLTLLGYLEKFGGWFPFVRDYCNAHKIRVPIRNKSGRVMMREIWDVSGASRLEELNTKLKSICMVRRKKTEVLTDLPDKTRVQVVFPINNRAEYNRAKTNLLDFVKAAAAEDEAFKQMLRLMSPEERPVAIRERQMEAAASAERAEQLVQIETLKQVATRGKMESVIEWINDFLETDEKLLIFATHVDAQMELLKTFPTAARIIAQDSGTARQANIDRFRKHPGCKLMIASLGAGGTGVDGLQEVCSNVAFLELAWTPAAHLQAEDRVHRIGQHDAATAYYLLAEDTIEEDIQAMLASKQAVCDSVLDGASEMRKGSIFDELLQVLAKK